MTRWWLAMVSVVAGCHGSGAREPVVSITMTCSWACSFGQIVILRDRTLAFDGERGHELAQLTEGQMAAIDRAIERADVWSFDDHEPCDHGGGADAPTRRFRFVFPTTVRTFWHMSGCQSAQAIALDVLEDDLLRLSNVALLVSRRR
jgi:hypothetical protein